MNKRKLLSALSLILVFCMLLGVGPLTGLTVTASALGTVSGGHSQVHTAYKEGTDLASIQKQNKTWAATTFLNQCATALDGSTDVTGATLPDLCIPGLNSTDNMIPQGMTYYHQKNWVLVSSYYNGSGKSSVVYALDMETGDFVAQFNLLKSDGTPCTSHVGGIAASEYNLYIADEGSTISYVPLSELNVTPGTKKDITIVDTATIGELGAGGTSFCSIDAGILWTGNFYRDKTLTDDAYSTPANSSYDSMIFGYALSGSSSAFEWDAFKNGAIKSVGDDGSVTERFTNNCVGNPTYSIAVPDAIQKIQCALVSEGRLYMGTSYGRKNSCDLYVANIDLNDALTENGNVTYTVGGTERKAYLFYSYKTFNNHLYMNEGMFMLKHELYILTESAAYKYYGETDSNKCTYPTDVVWKLDPYALVGEVTPGSDEEEVYYQRVNDLNEIGEDDEYIIVFKSENTEGGNSILYAIDARGGYNNTALPKMNEGAVASQESVSDNMGIIGKKITNYTLTNGGKKLVLNNADDDVDSIRWKIEKGSNNAVRMANSDSYFANTPYLYFGSRLMFMTMGQNTRFAKVTIGTAVDNGTTYFRFYFNGNRSYYMFCNDGTITDGIANYTRYYRQKQVEEAYGAVNDWELVTDHTKTTYYCLEEQPGTFHMDAYKQQKDYDSGNKLNYDTDGKSSSGLGYVNKMGTAVLDKYTYFSIYRRMVSNNGTIGKSNLFTNKTSAVSSDGTFSIDINTYATGQTQSALSDGSTPLDVVIVDDRSASMKGDKDCANYDLKHSISYDSYRMGDAQKDTYMKVDGQYYKIERGSYETYSYTKKTGDLNYDATKSDSNAWYLHSDGNYYQLQHATVYKAILDKNKRWILYFRDSSNGVWLLYTGDDCCTSGKTTHPAHYAGTTVPSDDDVRNSSHPCYNCYRTGLSKAIYTGDYYNRNTVTHYYLYFVKDGKTYYLDGLTYTEKMPSQYTNSSDICYTGSYYAYTPCWRNTAVTAALDKFVESLRQDAGKYNVDHRVAIVGFGNDDAEAKPTASDLDPGLFPTTKDWNRTGVWSKTGGDFITGDPDAIAENYYQNAFNSVSDKTVTTAIEKIRNDEYTAVYTCTAANEGLKMAYKVLNSSAAKKEYESGERRAVVIFVTDGIPGNKDRGVNVAKKYADYTIAEAKKIKDLGLCDIYSIYVGSETIEGFDSAKYMEAVSSNYPNATGYPGYATGELGEKNAKKSNYYKQISKGVFITDVLNEISYDQTTSGTAVSLNDKAVLKDVLSSSFSFPKTAAGEVDTSKVKVTLKIQSLSYDTKGVLTYGDIADANGVTYSFSKNAGGLDEINVQGFDYTANYVSTDHPGKQLLVKIEGVVANDGVAGNNVATNDISSGIYNYDGERLAELPLRMFPVPEVDIPVYDYIFDFGAVMPVKTQAYTLLAVSKEPTKLDSANYTLSAENVLGGKAEIKDGNVLDLTMSLQNSYIYAFLEDGENSYKWAKCNLVPASNVYFEETSLKNEGGEKQSWSTLGTSTVTEQALSSASDVYGFDNVYYGSDSAGFSGGSALKATVNSTNKQSNKVTFRFTGTAFDLISACGPNTGVLAVKVVGKEGVKKYFVVDTYYTDANYLNGGLAYNVPVMKFEGPYDTYDVEIGSLYLNSAGAVKSASKVRSFSLLNNIAAPSVEEMLASAGVADLDGFDIETVWMDDNSVLNGGTGSAKSTVRKARAARGVATYSNDVSLDAYIDAVRVYKPYGDTDPDTYIDGERNAKYVNVLDALKSGDISGTADKTLNYFELSNDSDELTFANYESPAFGGPQNEIYLKKGAGVSFTLNGFDPQKSSVMISLRTVRAAAAADNSVHLKINGNDLIVNSANELYYNLTGLLVETNENGEAVETNVITIVNESDDNLLAIDYIKIVDAKLGSDENQSKEKTKRLILESLNSKSVDFDPFSSYKRPSTDEASDGTDIILPTPGDSSSGGTDLSFIDSVVVILNKIIELILNLSKVPW